jgi:uncharacterized protein (TIGR02265 family)
MSPASSAIDPDGFQPIDWQAPLDIERYLSGVPVEHQIRGMFPDKVAKLAADHGHAVGRSRYIAFKFYPLSEHMELLAEAVPIIHPDCSLREGLRRLGAHAAPTLQDSMIGRVFNSFVGGPKGALSLVGKSYQTTRSGGTAKVMGFEEQGYVILSFRDVWDFPDALHVGIVQAFMRGLDLDWEPTLQVTDPCTCQLRLDNPAR